MNDDSFYVVGMLVHDDDESTYVSFVKFWARIAHSEAHSEKLKIRIIFENLPKWTLCESK